MLFVFESLSPIKTFYFSKYLNFKFKQIAGIKSSNIQELNTFFFLHLLLLKIGLLENKNSIHSMLIQIGERRNSRKKRKRSEPRQARLAHTELLIRDFERYTFRSKHHVWVFVNFSEITVVAIWYQLICYQYLNRESKRRKITWGLFIVTREFLSWEKRRSE